MLGLSSYLERALSDVVDEYDHIIFANKDPRTNPIFDLNVFAAQRDWKVLRKGIKLGMRIGK
ncbi:hypothetical protein CVT26_005210 [Gymnopilus dilepis]|uniref:Uncharacterized protein n=1 Tax=Gymnopilus dilepis TaxID=231916 RepID=A0A409YVF3_9AGAR|nr:hypothetical protein CVT26_005210 [Gymnopilus dilepis]